MKKKYDVIGIGSPLLDFIVEVSEERLVELDLPKGGMQLISMDESKRLLDLLEEDEMMVAPGGSSANTIAGASVLGSNNAFIGKIGNDVHGRLYKDKTINSGVASLLSLHESLSTGHAITFVTPDGERTFATHLGASQGFHKNDLFEEEIASSLFLHLEGFQLMGDDSLDALLHAIAIAKKNDTRISIDLSDASVINGHKELVKKILTDFIDIVFVNELEAEALTGQNALDSVSTIAEMCDIAVVKIGGDGSYIKTGGTIYQIPAYPNTMVNTNGAGDVYAGGVLHGLTHGADPMKAGHIGSFSASRVVGLKEARLNGEAVADVRSFISQLA